MAMKKKKAALPQAIATLKGQIQEMTGGLGEVNEALRGLAGQIGQFNALTNAVGGPTHIVMPAGPSQTTQPIQAMAGPHSLAPHEIAARNAILNRIRPDIEADLEREDA